MPLRICYPQVVLEILFSSEIRPIEVTKLYDLSRSGPGGGALERAGVGRGPENLQEKPVSA